MSREVASVYFHIGNGGVSFSVTDEGMGPVVHVKASHFGHETAHTQVAVNPEDLAVLASVFDYASVHEGYSETYCMAANAEQVKPVSLALELEADGVWEAPKRCCAGSKDVCCEEAEEECCKGKEASKCCGGSPGGFPVDDEISIHQGTGNADLSFWYNHQFVMNESHTITTELGSNCMAYSFITEHVPVLPGTFTGSVFIGDERVQTFVADIDGVFGFSPVGEPTTLVSHGSIDHHTGTITFDWNSIPPTHTVVCSYEYDMNPPKEKSGCCRFK